MDISPQIDRPFRVGFLLIDGFALIAYSAALSPLLAANELAGRKVYDIRNLPANGAYTLSGSKAVIKADAFPGEKVDFDLMIVVAGYEAEHFDNPRILQWLRLLSRRNVMIGGVGGGPVILARAGIMSERRMTVHWHYSELVEEIAKESLLEKALYVFDRDRLTCAGGLASVDMMHALIAHQHGTEFARLVSDWLLHTDVRPGDGPQRAGLVERYGITSQAVITAIELMENNLAEPLTLEELAAKTGLGTRQLNRQFHNKMNVSTMAFYKKLRLDKSMQYLKQTTLSITDIALATGYASSAHFSRAFREEFVTTPSDVRKKLNKN